MSHFSHTSFSPENHIVIYIAIKTPLYQNFWCSLQVLFKLDTQSETQHQISEEHIPHDSLIRQLPCKSNRLCYVLSGVNIHFKLKNSLLLTMTTTKKWIYFATETRATDIKFGKKWEAFISMRASISFPVRQFILVKRLYLSIKVFPLPLFRALHLPKYPKDIKSSKLSSIYIYMLIYIYICFYIYIHSLSFPTASAMPR